MFKIAVIGRPNVGKSSLFNALSGRNFALINNTPGLSRDRKEVIVNWQDMKFVLIDTGGFDDLEDIMNKKIWQQAQMAIEEANCVLFMLDGTAGVSPADKYLADILRKVNKPVISVINKADTKLARENLSLFHELGLEEPFAISAMHRIGFDDLYRSIAPLYGEYEANNDVDEQGQKPEITIAFVGKPNVGKSTIINSILQQERLITNYESGTTRDAIYLDIFHHGKKIKIIDTAGLRRKSKIEDESIEKLSTSDTIQAINFATVACLVISAEEGLTNQDLKIAKHIVEEGRGLIVVVNKIDLVDKKQQYLNAIAEEIERSFFQIKKPFVLGVSALKDNSLDGILDVALDLYQKWQFKISTSKFNIWLRETVANSEPPSISGRRLKVKYGSQIKTRPPTFNLWSNQKEKFPDSYLRYLQNSLYKDFNLWGCSLRFNIHKSENPYEGKRNESKKNQGKN
jgi:GTP-binding protein